MSKPFSRSRRGRAWPRSSRSTPRRLIERGYFELPSEVKAANAQYREHTDIVGAFIRECLVTTPGVSSPRTALYSAFAGWCKTEGLFTPPPREVFYGAVRRLPGVTETVRRFNGVAMTLGEDEHLPVAS